MKPSIQELFNILERRLNELEGRLKRPEEQLGHRAIFSRKMHGEVPASPGGSSLFLREDATWAAVDTGAVSGAVSDGDKGDVTVSGGGTIWTVDSTSIPDPYPNITNPFNRVKIDAKLQLQSLTGSALLLEGWWEGEDGYFTVNHNGFSPVLTLEKGVIIADFFSVDAATQEILGGDHHNLPVYNSLCRLQTTSPATISGFLADNVARNVFIDIINTGPDEITLLNEDAGSDAENRIRLVSSTLVIPPMGGCRLYRHLSNIGQRWFVTGVNVLDGGEVNTASNVGTGAELFKEKSAFDLRFRTLSASYAGGLTGTITTNANEIVLHTDSSGLSGTINSAIVSLSGTINAKFATISDSGEANTASNVGTGVGLFKQKDVFNLEFKSISGSYLGGLTGTILSNTDEVVWQVSAEPLSGTLNARIISLSGSVDSAWKTGDASIWNSTHAGVTASINSLSGTIDARFNTFIISGSGEINTASNVGTGAEVFKQKSALDLQFRTLSASYAGGLTGTITTNTNEIVLHTDSSGLSGTINSAIVSLSGTINARFSSNSGTVFAANEWAGGRESYFGTIPLTVGAFMFDPTINASKQTVTSSFFFRTVAASGLSGSVVYSRLYNLTDRITTCTASFLSTTTQCIDVALSVGGSGTQQIPSGPRIYEVHVYMSASDASGSAELYSAGLYTKLSLL